MPSDTALIEIRITPSGDIGWGEDPESAVVAAKTMCEDDHLARPYIGATRSATFLVDDVVIGHLPEAELWRAAL